MSSGFEANPRVHLDRGAIVLRIAELRAIRVQWFNAHQHAHHPVSPGNRGHRRHAAPPVGAPPVPTIPTPSPPPSVPPAASPPVNVAPVPGVMSAMEQQIVSLVNQQREANGLPALTVSTKLVQMAEIHSRDMAQLNDMEHDLPGAILPTIQDRASYVGYTYSWLGENIASGFPDAESVMGGWMNSPPHQANILNPNFTDIGVAVAYNSAGQPYYTQVFGQPS